MIFIYTRLGQLVLAWEAGEMSRIRKYMPVK